MLCNASLHKNKRNPRKMVMGIMIKSPWIECYKPLSVGYISSGQNPVNMQANLSDISFETNSPKRKSNLKYAK